jgi:cytochrome P450
VTDVVPTVAFEPTDLATVSDPYPMLRELRANGSITRTPSGFWCIAGYRAALDLLRHPAATSGPIALRYLAALPPGAARDEMAHRINFLDPPDHPRVRGLVSKAFTPRRVHDLVPFMEAVADDLLDALEPMGEFDLLDRYAHQLPSLVISEMLGVPTSDRDLLTGWSDAITPLLGVQLDDAERSTALDAAEEFAAYLGALIEQRRRAPTDDLLSALLAAEEDGERLSREELLSLTTTLYSAGHRTTRDLTTNGLSVLLTRRDLVDDVRSGRIELPALIWEFLRFETPTLFVARLPAEPIEIDGVELPELAPALILLASANRDPGAFADPDKFDPTRFAGGASGTALGPGPLSFAFGPHYCLGASLARTEAEVMVRKLLDRFRSLELAGDQLAWRQRGPFRSLTELRVRATV